MAPFATVALTFFALLAGLGLGYEIRDRRFIKEIRAEVREELGEQRRALAKRIDDLEDTVAGNPNDDA